MPRVSGKCMGSNRGKVRCVGMQVAKLILNCRQMDKTTIDFMELSYSVVSGSGAIREAPGSLYIRIH